MEQIPVSTVIKDCSKQQHQERDYDNNDGSDDSNDDEDDRDNEECGGDKWGAEGEKTGDGFG